MGGGPWGTDIGGGGRPAGPRCCCGCACAAAQHRAKATKPTNDLQGWPIFPHGIFIPGDQCIQISHDVIVLWIDFSHYIWLARRRCPRTWVMRDKSKGDNDRCHGRYPNNPSGTEPVPHPL